MSAIELIKTEIRLRAAQRGLSLDVGRQDHVVMRDPRQGEGSHGPPLPRADSCRANSWKALFSTGVSVGNFASGAGRNGTTF